MALAIELTSKSPGELLNMDPLEREFVVALATELESWRWEQMSKIMGG